MIRVIYSDAVERLAGALIERLEAGKASGRRGPLDPADILVPSRATASWLKLELARRTGIAANLRFDFLERFSTRLAEGGGAERTARPRRTRAIVAGRDVLQSAILRVLLDPAALARDELDPVRAYVGALGASEDAAELRRFQLSQELARVFDEHALTRRDKLRAWVERGPGEASELERWQRALFREVTAVLRAKAAEGIELALLPDLYEALPREALAPPKELHVFGVRIVSPVLLGVLARIAASSEVFLYTLNPVREFWDEREADEPPLLSAWGRAGRESVRLANELSEGDFEDYFSPPPAAPAATLLGALRDDVLAGRPARKTRDPELSFAGDRSITFLPCPGERREIEAIAGEIWSLIRRTEGLRFNDIAVVLAGRNSESYRAHAGAVFQETHGLPHHFIDVPMRGTSRVLEAIELLFRLPFSGFTRQDLLELILHPSVRGALGGIDPADWIRWLDALTVVHGADRADHAGTYIEKDLYNWDQGLKRLMLGTFLSGAKSGHDEPYATGGQLYLPEEVPIDRLASASRLITVVRSLVADARFARTARLTLPEWSELIGHLVTSYLGRASEEDERDVARCLSVIHELGQDVVLDLPVSFRIASELARARLGRATVNRGQPLADGVAIAPLSAISALPFRVVFITGLGEGQFPASSPRSPLDAWSGERRRGDVSAREHDEWLFLERLLATRDRVYLSWVSRDARTGDPLEPSSAVLELRHVLERGYVAEVSELACPLRRYDPSYFPEPSAPNLSEVPVPSPSARREHLAVELRADLVRALDGQDRRVPSLERLRAELRPEVLEAITGPLGLAPIPTRPQASPPGAAGAAEAPGAERAERVEVPWAAVRWFLEDPYQGWTRHVLRLRESDRLEDPLARESEPFSASALDAAKLLREVLRERLERGPAASFAALYDARAVFLELSGALATGVFGAADRARHLELLESWLAQLRALVPGLGEGEASRVVFAPPLRFGRASEDSPVPEVSDPIAIDVPARSGRPIRVELSGMVEPSITPPSGSTASIIPMLRAGARAPERDGLRGFFDHLALVLLGRSLGQPRDVFVLYGAGTPAASTFSPVEPGAARAWLAEVLAELLFDTHAYQLPFEDVLALAQGTSPPKPAGKSFALLPPVPPPTRAEARRIMERRFGLYLALRRTRA